MLAALVVALTCMFGAPHVASATGEEPHRAVTISDADLHLQLHVAEVNRAKLYRIVRDRQWGGAVAAHMAALRERQRAVVVGPTRLPQPPSGGVWARLASCESSGNWSDTDGLFEGGLQFAHQTWVAYGGRAYAEHAYDASAAQQIAIAEKVLAGQGPGAWPHCSYVAGLR